MKRYAKDSIDWNDEEVVNELAYYHWEEVESHFENKIKRRLRDMGVATSTDEAIDYIERWLDAIHDSGNYTDREFDEVWHDEVDSEYGREEIDELPRA